MPPFTFTVAPAPDDSAAAPDEWLPGKVAAALLAAAPPSSIAADGHAVPLLVVARSDSAEGAIVGAAQGHVRADGVYVSLVAVSPDARKQGLGRALIAALTRAAGPTAAVVHLNAFDFQGTSYYPRLGFAEDCILGGWAHGIVATFFSAPAGALVEWTATPAGCTVAAVDPAADPATAAAAEEFLMATVAANEAELMPGLSDGFEAFTLQATAAPGEDGGAGALVGALAAVSFWGGLVITDVAVDEAHRRRGVGRSLVAAAVERAREAGCTVAVVEALSCQAPEFWGACGFAPLGAPREGFAGGLAMVRRAREL